MEVAFSIAENDSHEYFLTKLNVMDKIKRLRMIFCQYLLSLIKEQQFGIENIVRATNKSYTEVKKILDGLISPSLDDLLIMADLLNLHITFTKEIPLAHKKIAQTIPLHPDRSTADPDSP